MRNLLSLFLIFWSLTTFSQIKIDDVGDGWKTKVLNSLALIEKIDTNYYNLLSNVCTNITFWNGDYSTTDGVSTIVISQKDMQYNSLNNIAAIIVHESKHLYYIKNCIIYCTDYEEIMCYMYELTFLYKIPNVEGWLIDNANSKINYYNKKSGHF
jgi:hypothetical protein